MPASFVIHSRIHLIYTRFEGPTTRADIAAVRSTVASDPGFNPQFNLILDFRDADLSPLSAADITSLASTTPFNPHVKRVLVADSDAKFGMSRMFQIRRNVRSDDDRTIVVRTLDEARSLLGLGDFDPTEAS